jgi:hypothetical protein
MDRRRFVGVAASIAAGLALSGCSDGQSRHSSSAATAGHAPAAARPQPTPIVERDLPGDRSWRVRSLGPQQAVEGYADKASILPGEDVGLHLSTTAATLRVSAFRVGWHRGAEARLVWRSGPIRGARQPPPSVDRATRTVHASWPRTSTVHTAGWPEGAYLLRLDTDSGHQRYIPLVIRSASAAGKTLLVHATATWQAYNTWGGASLYTGRDGTYGTRSFAVSFDRPYDADGADRFMVYERAAVVIAERLGIPLAYTTGIDIATDPRILRGAAAVVFLGHDEYWTPQQRDHVTRARDAGANLAFLGANTCYRRIRLDPAGRTVTCYKDSADQDPMYRTDPALVTTDFAPEELGSAQL